MKTNTSWSGIMEILHEIAKGKCIECAFCWTTDDGLPQEQDKRCIHDRARAILAKEGKT